MAAAKKRKGPARPPAPDKQPGSVNSTGSGAQAKPAAALTDRERWRPAAPALLVFVVLSAAIGVVYGPGARAPFVHDDGASILANHSLARLWPLVGSPGPLNPAKDLPTSGRPLVNLSLALNYRIGHYNTLGYHLFSLVVHTSSATLVWALVRRVLRLDYFRDAYDLQADWLAFGIALVWALHPLLTQSVEYITQRSELLLGLCYLSTMYASLRYLTAEAESARRKWLIAATLACFAGMACKETMVTAPVMVALFDFVFIAGTWRSALQKSWPLYVALASSWLLLIGLNLSGPRSASAGFQSELPAHVWWLTQAEVVVMYLKLAFWPSPLLMHWDVPRLETLGAAWPWVLPVAAMLVVTAVLLYRKSALGFLGAWFFLILSPTLVVPIVTEVAAERRMYLPLMAIVTLVILGGFRLVEWLGRRGAAGETTESLGRRSRIIVMSAALVLAIVCGVASARRVGDYLDPVTLWQTVLDAQPDNVVAQIGVSDALIQAGRPDEAYEHIQQALASSPELYVPHHAAGSALLGRGQHLEAIAHFEKVVELKPNSASAYNNLAFALSSAGRREEAIALYEKALELDPDYLEAHNNLATTLATEGKFIEALRQYAIVVRIQPDYAGAHKSMAIILVNSGRPNEAIEHLETAARWQPDPDTYARLAFAYASVQRISEAVATAERGLELARSTGQADLINRFEALRTNLLTSQAQPKQ